MTQPATEAGVVGDGWHRVDYPHMDRSGVIADVRLVQNDTVMTRNDGGIPVESCLRWGWKFTPVVVMELAAHQQLEARVKELEGKLTVALDTVIGRGVSLGYTDEHHHEQYKALTGTDWDEGEDL